MNHHHDLHQNFCRLTTSDQRRIIGWMKRRLFAHKFRTVYLRKITLGAAMVNTCVMIIITTPMLLGDSMLLAATGIGLLACASIYGEALLLIGDRLRVG